MSPGKSTVINYSVGRADQIEHEHHSLHLYQLVPQVPLQDPRVLPHIIRKKAVSVELGATPLKTNPQSKKLK